MFFIFFYIYAKMKHIFNSMVKEVKYKVLLILSVLFFFIAEFSFCQLAFINKKIYTQGDLLTEATRPRPGFKKRRYATHTFYAEAGLFAGYYQGKRYSINYELLAQSAERNALTLRIGYGHNEASNDSSYHGNEKFVPVAVNILIGYKNLFEIGIGSYYYVVRKIITPYISLGFRHQKPQGGFNYKIAVDLHLERVFDLKGKELQKTGVFGPIIGAGWTF